LNHTLRLSQGEKILSEGIAARPRKIGPRRKPPPERIYSPWLRGSATYPYGFAVLYCGSRTCPYRAPPGGRGARAMRSGSQGPRGVSPLAVEPARCASGPWSLPGARWWPGSAPSTTSGHSASPPGARRGHGAHPVSGGRQCPRRALQRSHRACPLGTCRKITGINSGLLPCDTP